MLGAVWAPATLAAQCMRPHSLEGYAQIHRLSVLPSLVTLTVPSLRSHPPTRPQLVFLVMSYLTSSKNKTFHYITTLVRACAWKAAPVGATCRW